MIAFDGASVIALYKRHVDRSKWLDFFSSLELSSGTCFIADNILYRISSIEWSSTHLCMWSGQHARRWIRPEQVRDRCVPHRVRKQTSASCGTLCTRQGHLLSDEARNHVRQDDAGKRTRDRYVWKHLIRAKFHRSDEYTAAVYEEDATGKRSADRNYRRYISCIESDPGQRNRYLNAAGNIHRPLWRAGETGVSNYGDARANKEADASYARKGWFPRWH